MDLNGIRTDLAKVFETLPVAGTDAKWQALGWVPDDPGTLPAAVSGVPTEIGVVTMGGAASIKLAITLYTSLGDPRDGQYKMDKALSTGNAESAIDALKNATSTYWRGSLGFGTPVADQPRLVLVGSNNRALAVNLNLEITTT